MLMIPATKVALDRQAKNRCVKRTSRKERFDDLVAKIKCVALDLNPGEKLPGVYEMCNAMGVSVATLTRALNELEASNVIIRKPGIGIFTSPNAGKQLISLVCDPTFFRSGGGSPFWDMLIRHALSRAESHDELLDLHFSAIVGDSLELPPGLTSDVISGRISGVIFVGTFKEGVEWIENHGVPVVVFAGAGSYTVKVDEGALIRSGAAMLGRCGCRRIGLIRPDNRVIISSDIALFNNASVNAFRCGLAESGAAYLPELVRPVTTTVSTGPWLAATNPQEAGYRMALEWFMLPPDRRPDGLVVTEDLMTLGVLAAAQEIGVAVGSDVCIASHTNKDSATLTGWEDSMIPLKVDPARIAAVMFEQLERLMEGQCDVLGEVLIPPVVADEAAKR